MKIRAYLIFLLTIFIGITACQSPEKLGEDDEKATKSQIALATMLDTSRVFSSNLTGFALYDPQRNTMVYAQNENRYFTPASNTKLFTFYTGLKLLPDSVRALEYQIRGDSLIFWGTGDPSFLHPDFGNRKVYHFLKNRNEKLYFSDSNFDDKLLGPGWAWSDYQHSYQTEKSPLPLYGNVARFTVEEIELRKIASTDSGLAVSPKYFRSFVKEKDKEDIFLHRGLADNTFSYSPKADTVTDTLDKPFHYTPQLVADMLSDTLDTKVGYAPIAKPESTRVIYSIPSDTAYKRMLQPSDNFIAEQLLLVTASELGIPLNSGSVIDTMKANYLGFLSREPQWVDGSGLSRYNMFTPRSMIQLLMAIDEEFRRDEELYELLPAGGERGTIKNWYGARDGGEAYLYAKTGTLSNNHCLSGYLITSGGKKLIFSFMNNHYVGSSSVVKREMEKVLWFIHKNY